LFQFSLSLSNIWLRYNEKPKGVFFNETVYVCTVCMYVSVLKQLQTNMFNELDRDSALCY